MIAYYELVKGHIYIIRPNTAVSSRIACYVGKGRCLVFWDDREVHGSFQIAGWDCIGHYTVEQDVTNDYEFGLEEIPFPPPYDRIGYYQWYVKAKRYWRTKFFDLPHALLRMKENLRYGVSDTIEIPGIGTFSFQEDRIHFSKDFHIQNAVLKAILLEIFRDSVYGRLWDED